ncbi:MAG TPA: hypothetical protein VLW45_08430, partial [Pelomicrobium sp.]|nr:hypothetical protein [Pelomicrobium sp.]
DEDRIVIPAEAGSQGFDLNNSLGSGPRIAVRGRLRRGDKAKSRRRGDKCKRLRRGDEHGIARLR